MALRGKPKAELPSKLPRGEGGLFHQQPCFCLGCRAVRDEEAAKAETRPKAAARRKPPVKRKRGG